jgi:hypothetical protein
LSGKEPLNVLFISNCGIGALLEHKLRGEHHPEDRVVSAARPEACKELLLKEKFDLLITGGRILEDGGAGLELVAFAKHNCPETKVVVMSIWTNEEEALAAGADKHWPGSSDFSGLIEIVKELFPS